MIIFAKADPGSFGAFKDELKTYLALKEIRGEIKSRRMLSLTRSIRIGR